MAGDTQGNSAELLPREGGWGGFFLCKRDIFVLLIRKDEDGDPQGKISLSMGQAYDEKSGQSTAGISSNLSVH